jgi:hypothetical protein
MDPNIILPHITQFVNQHYEAWDQAHPNQMWNNAQKAIVNNFIMNRINDAIEANEDELLGEGEIQEIYNNLAEMLDELFVLGNNNPANVDLFQDNFNLLDNDNNNDDDNIIEPDNQGEQSPTSVADPRLNGGKKRKRKTIKKRKSIQRRKSRRRKSSRRRK